MRVASASTLALLLAACAPAAPPAQQGSAEPEAGAPHVVQHPDTAALAAAPAAGQWFERTDEGVTGAGFGAPNSEYQFVVTCTAPSGALTIMSANELAPDQATTIRLITSTRTLELPARSFNEGLPSLSAEVADADPLKPLLIGMLGAPTDRFAVVAGGESTVFPWHESIARTLIACR
ncbi:MAG: hypothetical protein ACT4OF_05545 [Caulobacteraceae bacterium]